MANPISFASSQYIPMNGMAVRTNKTIFLADYFVNATKQSA